MKHMPRAKKKHLKNSRLARIVAECESSRSFRYKLSRESHSWFLKLYLGHYLNYPLAWFHEQMLAITEDPLLGLATVMAFRGAGKSTIMNLSLALWSILGKPQKKFIVIVSKSSQQAKIHLDNIRLELEQNKHLRNDFDILQCKRIKQAGNSLEITQLDCKIIAISTTKSLRGLRHGSHRPDLIICDDLEDSRYVLSKSTRESTYQWFLHEVAPLGNTQTKIIVLGNLLHPDSFVMNLKQQIETGKLNGIFRAYPLLDDNNKILWLEKFRSHQDIEQLKLTISSELVWLSEYLLTSVSGIPASMSELRSETTTGLENNIKRISTKKHINQKLIDMHGYKISAPIVMDTKWLFGEANKKID